MHPGILALTLGLTATPPGAAAAAEDVGVPAQPQVIVSDRTSQHERLLGLGAPAPRTRAAARGGTRPPLATEPGSSKLPDMPPHAASPAAAHTPLEVRLLLEAPAGRRPAVGPADVAAPPGAPAPGAPAASPRPEHEARAAGPAAASARLTAFETDYLKHRSQLLADPHCQHFTIGADDIAFSGLDERHKRAALASLLEQAASSRCVAPAR